jgi:hypothetical protein
MGPWARPAQNFAVGHDTVPVAKSESITTAADQFDPFQVTALAQESAVAASPVLFPACCRRGARFLQQSG